MRRLLIALLLSVGLSGLALSQPLTILCEDDPPDQFLSSDGKLSGYTIDLVREIQRRVGTHDPIAMVPWARGYKMIQEDPNTVLFQIVWTPERNDLFKWLGPIKETVFGFYSRSDSNLRIGSMEDAKRVRAIGVYRSDVRDQMLTDAGFTNLERAGDNVTNVKKLMAGRIDLYVSTNSAYADDARAAGFKPEDLRLVYAFQQSQIYIAMSKGTPDAIVSAWDAALDSMRKGGSFLAILRKYHPDMDLPAPAPARH